MLCDKYKEAMTAAVAEGAALPQWLRKHVDACPDCGASLAAQHALFAAIDVGLRNNANAEVPPPFLPKVRANMGAEAVPARNLVPRWAFVCAIAGVVLTIALLSLPRKKQTGAESLSATREASPDAGGLGWKPAQVRKAPYAPRVSRTRTQQNISAAKRDPEVLVPSGEEEFVRRYYTSVQERAGGMTLAIADEHDLTPKPLVIDQIELRELTIEGLEERASLEQTNTK
jgi:hypothetical protein